MVLSPASDEARRTNHLREFARLAQVLVLEEKLGAPECAPADDTGKLAIVRDGHDDGCGHRLHQGAQSSALARRGVWPKGS